MRRVIVKAVQDGQKEDVFHSVEASSYSGPPVEMTIEKKDGNVHVNGWDSGVPWGDVRMMIALMNPSNTLLVVSRVEGGVAHTTRIDPIVKVPCQVLIMFAGNQALPSVDVTFTPDQTHRLLNKSVGVAWGATTKVSIAIV